MPSEHVEPDSIGPDVDLVTVELSPAIGDRIGTLLGTESPANAAEFVDALERTLGETEGRTPSASDLCTTDDGLHAFEGDGEYQEYVCVLDPLIYPALSDTPGIVRSTTPVRNETLEIEVDADGTTVSHEDVVVSFGVSDHVDDTEDPTYETVYRQVCGYIHAFADEAEYETWAEDVEAATTALPIDRGVGLAGGLARELFE